ncbi:hypothetical protein GCM10010193_48650 [Kitasatospora atroaurantiaca]|uniref:Excalibur calcium-binding domain-containing protein n=1 Tax=Kitasatospora atroaurantiaca TaxID=285545 RepID=A0A561EYT8_9ACTN|nr:hypothetical protein [Kitasatospora atroaurantiaca]TWE20757.1 hypothetical protein FB465_5915 [Kitasatospora atroaurantiaca]
MLKSIPSVLVAVAVAGAAAGTTLGLAQASPTAAPAPATVVQQDSAQATPAPHILDFAHGLKDSPKKLPASATAVPQPVDVDGCDHDYGVIGQCVPVAFPPGVGTSTQERCDWLKAHGFKELKVHNRAKAADKDKLKLDKNKDGVACGRGD